MYDRELTLISWLCCIAIDAIFNVGVQLNLIDISGSGREEIALATSSSSTKMEETISSVMGHKFLGTLAPFEIPLEPLLKRGDTMYKWEIKGMVSKNPKADLPNRIINYYCINGRVVEMPKVTSILRRVWNGFGARKKASCILNFTLPNDCFDINLSPDKQHVLLTHEAEILDLIEERAVHLWSSHSQGVFEFQKLEVPTEDNGDDFGDDSDRQMHKRRFAFVHDLGNAKLQHHSDDRHEAARVDGNEAVTINGVEGADEQTEKKEGALHRNLPEAESDEDPPSKRSRISDDEIPVDEMKHRGSKRTGPASIKVSDSDRRQWNQVQARFNGKDGSGMKKSTPVTPHDDADTTTANQESSSTHSEKSKNGQSDAGKSQKQLLLQQFAFKAVETNDQNPPSRRTRSNGRHRDVDEHTSHAKDQVRQGSTKEFTQPAALHRRLRTRDEESQAKPPSPMEPAVSLATPTDDVEDVTLVAGGEDESSSKEVDFNKSRGQPPDPVAWTTFHNADHVAKSARLERLQMTRRKLFLRNRGSGMNLAEPSVDKGAEDVTESVGISGTTSSTSISLSKEQFRQGMEVIGQFNLGFILLRCENDNLWIADQHACDEKFNFENLYKSTKIHEQRLLKPLKLELSAAEESCILDHMNVFEANGFRFDFQANGPIRQRLSLTALPHSGAQDGRKAVQFGKEDVRTLCSILMEGSSYDAGDGGTGTDGGGLYGNNAVRRYASTASSQIGQVDRIIARLPKAIAMFASRACRTSIMIGTALSRKEMEKVVKRLADVDHPWNCPHGRPTMRHIGAIRETLLEDERELVDYVTAPTVTIAPLTQDANDENKLR